MKLLSRSRAFTLIELLLVIVVASVLAVAVGPKLFDRQSYTPFHSQAKMLSLLRSTQIKAMQQRGEVSTTCHRVIFRQGAYGNQNDSHISCDNNISSIPLSTNIGAGSQGEANVELDQLTLFLNNSSGRLTVDFAIGFDGYGRPLDACAGGCRLDIEGDTDSASVCIESEGYIHAC